MTEAMQPPTISKMCRSSRDAWLCSVDSSLDWESTLLSVFFAPARYRVVNITCPCSEMVLQTMKNCKAHYNLFWFRLLQGNSPRSNIFDIEVEQCYNGGEQSM
jgi:hypothetical protein